MFLNNLGDNLSKEVSAVTSGFLGRMMVLNVQFRNELRNSFHIVIQNQIVWERDAELLTLNDRPFGSIIK